MHRSDRNEADVAQAFRALGSPARLAILKQLDQPRSIQDIRVPARGPDGWGRGPRTMTRQAVRRHLATLLSVGLIRRGARARTLTYLRDLSRLDPIIERLLELRGRRE